MDSSFYTIFILGCFIAGLEYSADVTAEVIGKPEKTFFNAALSHLNSTRASAEITKEIEKEGNQSNIFGYDQGFIDAITYRGC